MTRCKKAMGCALSGEKMRDFSWTPQEFMAGVSHCNKRYWVRLSNRVPATPMVL